MPLITTRSRLLGSSLLVGALFLVGAPARADVVITPEARAHFQAGVNLLKDPGGARYEEAYQEFKAAYKASPSPRILGNMGLCAMKLERDEEAIDAYQKYLAGVADLDAAERKQIEIDIATLKNALAHVSITTSVKGARIVDQRVPVQGSPVTNLYGPIDRGISIGLHPGHHTITIKLDNYQTQTWEVEAAPGGNDRHDFILKKVEVAPPPVAPGVPEPIPMERPVPASVWVTGSLTVALAIGGGVMGGLALAKKSDFDKANTGKDPANAQSIKDSGQKLNVVTDVLLGTAVVGAVVTTVLYATRPSVPVTSGTGSLGVSVGWLPGGGSAALSGKF